ncbi:PHP domain-containing protein [Candidatus Microgenomates bacterium]|nr:PHP domain-containing protein [Candidatus Microgenomates bacterium]
MARAELEQRPSDESFILLHNHTYFTFLAATSSPEAIVRAGKRLGHSALGIADHNLYGAWRFMSECNKQGVKPIVGVELPVSLGLYGYTTATLLAQDNDGFFDLSKWTSKVHRDKQMLEIDDIEKRKGKVTTMVRGPIETIREVIELYGFFYALDSQSNENLQAATLIEREFPERVVVAHDVRMADLDQVNLFRLMLYLIKRTPHTIDPNRTLNYVLQNPRAIAAMYSKRFPSGLANTVEIARDAHLTLPEAPQVRAKIVPEGVRSSRFLEYLVETKLAQRQDREVLLDRIDHELSMIKNLGFSDYILICYEIAQYCKNRGIEYSVTGSGNNSAVLNALDITHVDAHDLLFERFLNTARVDLPDVDFDVPYDKKEEVMRFILDRYENASKLTVVRHLRQRGIIQLAKRAHIPLTSRQVQEIELAQIPIGTGTHASGVVLADNPPQQRIGENVIAQLDKDDAEKILKLHKIDILANNGLTKIARTKEYCAQIGIEAINIPGGDTEVMRRIFSGDTISLANIESPHVRGLVAAAGTLIDQPRQEHIAQIVALARPAASTREPYFQWLAGKTESVDPRIDPIIGKTGGTIIFQEQILRLATEVAGLPWNEADKLRKLTSEGIPPEEISHLRQQFIEGCLAEGIERSKAEKLFYSMEQFKSYGFIEGHARSLAKTTYECAWLAEKYPVEWWTSVVNTKADGEGLYPMQAYVNEALRHGVSFSFPSLDLLEQYAQPRMGSVAIGKNLVARQKDFEMKYSRFLQNMHEGRRERNPAQFIRSQLELFGISFTDNPMVLVSQQYYFDPLKESGEIIGQPMLDSKREDVGYRFISIDSGTRIVDVAIPLDTPLYRRKKDNLDPHTRFWRVAIRKESNYIEAIDILRPPNV